MRLGIVGRGPWAQKILCSLPAEPVWTAGRDWRSQLDKQPVEGIIVACAAAAHEEVASECFRRRIPVFLEKPAALGLEATQRLVSVWEENDRPPVIVDHLYCFHPAFLRMTEIAWDHRACCGGYVSNLKDKGVVVGGPKVRPDCPTLWDWGPHAYALDFMLPEGGSPPVIRRKLPTNHVSAYYECVCGVSITFDAYGVPGATLLSHYHTSTAQVHYAAIDPLQAALSAFEALCRGEQSEHAGLELALKIAKHLHAREAA